MEKLILTFQVLKNCGYLGNVDRRSEKCCGGNCIKNELPNEVKITDAETLEFLKKLSKNEDLESNSGGVLLPGGMESEGTISEDELRKLQETADAEGLLLPSQFNVPFERKFADDNKNEAEEILLPNTSIKFNN